MGHYGVNLGRDVSALSPSYHLGQGSHFVLVYFSSLVLHSAMWLMVAGLMWDNYFLRCLEALSSKEGELQHCVLFCA